MPSSKKLTIH